MDFKNVSITDLLPQRPPFVMVDRVISCDETDAVTELTIREDNIFLDDNVFSPAGIIENMAQACAARMGCICMMNDGPVKIGYIGDIRNCFIHRQPRSQETLSTRVHVLEEVLNLTLAEVITTIGDEVIATARMKIALTD